MPEGEPAELGFTIESLPLLPGSYQLEIHLKDMARRLVEFVPRTYKFEVAETEVYGGRKLDGWFGNVGLKARPLDCSRNVERRSAMISRIKNLRPLRFFGKYFSAPRSENDYATHVPILIGLARMRQIKNVLEFGCGRYSTLTFLNRKAFPDLVKLHSIENDISWGETMSEIAKQDERWTLRLVPGDIAPSVSELDLESFDLILIDDSKTSAERAATICAVAKKQPQRPLIAIHDFEVGEYQEAATRFRRRYKFRAFTPKTGLTSNNAVDIRRLKRLVNANARNLEPDDIEAWIKTFSLNYV